MFIRGWLFGVQVKPLNFSLSGEAMKYSVAMKAEFSTSAVYTVLQTTLRVGFPEVLNCSMWYELAVQNLCSAQLVPENSLHPTLCIKTRMFYCRVLLRMWEKEQSNINNLF